MLFSFLKCFGFGIRNIPTLYNQLGSVPCFWKSLRRDDTIFLLSVWQKSPDRVSWTDVFFVVNLWYEFSFFNCCLTIVSWVRWVICVSQGIGHFIKVVEMIDIKLFIIFSFYPRIRSDVLSLIPNDGNLCLLSYFISLTRFI